MLRALPRGSGPYGEVLRAVGSTSQQPDSWRQRFHHVRKAAAKFGKGRAEIFSGTAGPDTRCPGNVSP